MGGFSGGVGVVGGVGGAAPAARQKALRRDAAFATMAAPAPEEAMVARSEIASSVTGIEGRELGELFEYGFATPVTVRKERIAMLHSSAANHCAQAADLPDSSRASV